MVITWVVVVVVLLAIINFILNKRQSIRDYIRYRTLLKKLPVAKDDHFLLGHAVNLLGCTPEEIYHKVREWMGVAKPFVVIHSPVGNYLSVNNPDVVEAIISPVKNLDKAVNYVFLHRWLGSGLLTSKGSQWHQRRKILTPAFHFSILLEFIDVFNRETRNFTNRIEKSHLNQTVNITPLISDFTLETLSETSMGTKIDLQTQEGVQYKQAILQQGIIVFKRFISPWMWLPPLFALTSYKKLEDKALTFLHNFTSGIIQKRSLNFQTFDENFDNTTKRKSPLLDILLNAKFKIGSIDDMGIRNEVDTFMFEGHDTTSMCINYTTMLLACHPEIQEEVYREITNVLGTDLSTEPTYANLQEMNLLERCIKESLRLFPPVPLIGRKTSEEIPTKFGTIPKGMTAYIFVIDLHRDPDYWPNPYIFDPSRHLPENSLGRHTFSFIPFSAGPRNCIGQRFAMLEIKAFFCGILRKFILEAVDTPESLVLIQEIVLRPRDGVKVRFRLRQ